MSKSKISFNCIECNYTTIKWLGCCPECNSWDSFHEKKTITKTGGSAQRTTAQLLPLTALNDSDETRMVSGITEWDRVVGGGIMPNSLLILTGDPGIGKSTLLLQIAHQLAESYTVFYFSSEESLQQIKQRAVRLNCTNSLLLFSDEAHLPSIVALAQEKKPTIIIIDSIQNCYLTESQSTPGSIAQLRESAFLLMRLAKENSITVIASGHITKEGTIAGPKTLEHMVDGVFYLQGDERFNTRILRSVKNRFGTINELGFFEMNKDGLCELPDINKQLLANVSNNPGSALISILEGSRPLLLELQALTIHSKLTIPQRVISGVDHKQVVLIAAILEKYLQIKLSTHDIFFKVTGGFKIKESGTDLGIALALLSSYFQQPIPERSIALGEINLTGQIQPINHISTFIREAQKFGIQNLLIAHKQPLDHELLPTIRFKNVYELLSLFPEHKSST